MILVTTPTGNTGSALLHELVASNEQVRVLVRNPAKLPSELRSRIEVVQGSLLDEETFARALDDCHSFFLCVPTADDASDVRAHYEAFARVAIAAATRAGTRRVVYLSGAGKASPLAQRAGAATALFVAEEMLAGSGLAVRALRCPVFYESTLWQIPAIKHAQRMFGLLPGDYQHGQVAVQDIATTAAALLRDQDWSDVQGVSVFGPTDISLNEIATLISAALDRTVDYQQLSRSAYIETLARAGVSAALAQAVVDMFEAIGDGLFDAEPRMAVTSNGTTMPHWIDTVFVPAFHAPQAY